MLLQVHHIYDMSNILNLLVFVLYKKNWMNIDVFFPSMNYMTWIVVASFKAMSECKLYYYRCYLFLDLHTKNEKIQKQIRLKKFKIIIIIINK
jgi:hypothetical protein